jgi:hypothetical protein
MERLAVAAREGRLDWFDEVLHRSGYVRADEGIRQVDLVEAVPSLTRATLRNWAQEGLPVKKAGSGRFYDPIAFISWLHARFVRAGRPRDVDGAGVDYETEDVKWRARTRKLNFHRLAETTMQRSEAAALMTGMIVETRAALTGMVATAAPQLEHQTDTEVRRVLDRQVRYVCAQMAAGFVPVPVEVSAEVKKIRDEACDAAAAVVDRHYEELAAEAEEEDAGGGGGP